MKITELLNLKWDYQITEHLINLLFDKQKRDEVFERYLSQKPDLSQDCFLQEFQENFADRKTLKQDFTPSAICQLVSQLTPEVDSVLDVCAGTGALTIAKWKINPNATFYCQEYSKEAIAFLLFNLCVRGITAEVKHCDVLTGETFAEYRLTRNGQYSDIEKATLDWRGLKVDCVVSNPPYSAKWNPVSDERFEYFGLAPKTAADYAFVLHGLHHLKEEGTAHFILPHGLLFRGNSEGKIRQKLIEQGYLSGVIGLPANLFISTGIPVALFTFKKQSSDIYIIDAADLFEKAKPNNIMRPEHVNQVLTAYQLRRNIDKLAHLANYTEIQENDFNLNIPRYVDKSGPEPEIDLLKEAQELLDLTNDIEKSGQAFVAMLAELEMTHGSAEDKAEFEQAKQILAQVFAPRTKEKKAIQQLISSKQGSLFITEQEIEELTGFIEHELKIISQLETIKKYFLSKMFI